MPIDNPVIFRQGDFHQAALAWPAHALSGIGPVSGAMTGAQQPLAAVVENLVGLPIELHRNMGAAVQVGMGHSLITDGKGPAGLTGVIDVKRQRLPTFQ